MAVQITYLQYTIPPYAGQQTSALFPDNACERAEVAAIANPVVYVRHRTTGLKTILNGSGPGRHTMGPDETGD